MKLSFSFAGMALTGILLLGSCKKSGEPLQTDTNNSTGTGTPGGQAITKTIDAAGGQLSSADGRLQVIIPAGALSAAKQVSIQPISNLLPAGIGAAYRITPHGEQFSKPVILIFSYKDEDLQNTLPEFLDIAYQDEKGNWQAIKNAVADKQKKEITVTSTHFSDWGYFKSLMLEPADAAVEQGGEVNLKVSTLFPLVDPDDQPTVAVLKTPRELGANEIKGWSYAGEGMLISRAAQGFYTAPDHVPAANPEVVNVNIQMHRKGQFMLVSNITVMSKYHTDWLQVDENEFAPGANGKCSLYIYGSFGTDPGAGKRAVTIGGNAVEVTMWTPGIVVCKIDAVISGEIQLLGDGKLRAKSNLRKYSGVFTYNRYQGGLINSQNNNALRETTDFTLVYRGFGQPCPANLDPLFKFDAQPAFGSFAGYSLSGSAAVSTPASANPCITTTSVSLPTKTGIEPLDPTGRSMASYFKAHVKEIENGIEVRIEFVINDLITGVKVQRTSCNGSSYDPPRGLQVGFEGFNNKPINLSFAETSGLKLKGTDQLVSNKMASSILIEAWDGTETPSHYETDGLMPATLRNHQ